MTEHNSEQNKEKKRDAMVRALVQRAGPSGVFVTLAAFVINIIPFSILYVVYLRGNAARTREIEESGEFDEVGDLAN